MAGIKNFYDKNGNIIQSFGNNSKHVLAEGGKIDVVLYFLWAENHTSAKIDLTSFIDDITIKESALYTDTERTTKIRDIACINTQIDPEYIDKGNAQLMYTFEFPENTENQTLQYYCTFELPDNIEGYTISYLV
jgi:hypothetical protein